MQISEQSYKNLTIIALQVAAIFLMVFQILPRELSIIVTGIMVFHIIFSPLRESLWVLVASIPFYVALPLTTSFDTVANWRILVITLFLVMFFRQGTSIALTKNSQGKFSLREKFKSYQTEHLLGVIVALSFISLFVADDAWVGLKKIVFLINAFLVYIIIRNVCFVDRLAKARIISGLKIAGYTILGIGLFQLALVFFVNLHQFWHFWDRHVISVFYGQMMSDLTSISNTWFSYYSYQLPTLRMFSIFPDSHSFAMTMMLLLPFSLYLVYTNQNKSRIKKIGLWLLLISNLLAIIFSGSRGAWVSAGLALLCTIALVVASQFKFGRSLAPNFKSKMQLIIGSLLIFFFLFPLASAILFLPQYIQLGWDSLADMSLFERSRSIFNFNELSVKSRLEIWTRTLDSVISHPLLGVGIGNFPSVLNENLSYAKMGSSAHSLYFELAAEMGVFAAILLIVFFWQVFKRAWEILIEKIKLVIQGDQIFVGFFSVAILMVIGYSIFDVVLLNDKVLLFFSSFLGVLYAHEE